MSVNIQVGNIEDFNKLKEIADYSSELTKVISLSDDGVLQANIKFPGLLKKYEVEKVEVSEKAIAKYKNGKILIEKASADLLLFLQVYSSANPQVKTGAFDRFFIALNNNLIELDQSMKDLLTPMNYKSTIGELLSSKGKVRFRGKLWSLNELGKDERIQKTLLFHEAIPIKTRFLPLKDMSIIEFDSVYGITKICDPIKQIVYNVKFYSHSPLLKQILKPGRIINLITPRIYGDKKNGYTLNSPIVIPRDLDIKEIETLKCPRTIPVSFYNAAWYEYMYRFKLKK